MAYRRLSRRRWLGKAFGVRGLGQDATLDPIDVNPNEGTVYGGAPGATVPMPIDLGIWPAGATSFDTSTGQYTYGSSPALPGPGGSSGPGVPGSNISAADAAIISQALKSTSTLATVALQAPGQYTTVSPTGAVTTSRGVPGAVPAPGASVSAAFSGISSSVWLMGAAVLGALVIFGGKKR
jgi:hypothetical protein